MPSGSRSDPFIPTPTAAARYLVWIDGPKGFPCGVSRDWVGLSRLGAEPLLRRCVVVVRRVVIAGFVEFGCMTR